MVSELLPTPHGRVVWGAVAVLLAVVLGRLLKWYVHRLEQRRPDGEREPAKLRRGETAIVITIIIGFAAQRRREPMLPTSPI